MKIYRKNKYGAKRCRCVNNHIHQSKGEAGYCNDLTLRVKAGDLAKFEIQKKFELHGVDGRFVTNHYVDFLLTDFNEEQEIHEYKSKGTVTPEWKLKKTLCQIEYPKIPYIIVWHKTRGYKTA